ncbi:hypothetical protein G6O67_002601 [Ophiocordyceps sinensis]|uniref:Uncharacterized protein n=1 Tax=Ophiocordyceps sinensis TaxID=72228 RepID=A0A8H4PUL7_9HYPO|nr:hypothetical protein G6O67_002601 [Ophiocordyceps sinensis]
MASRWIVGGRDAFGPVQRRMPSSSCCIDRPTCTSFSLSETRSTISRRACLSGLGLFLYASSSIILSLALSLQLVSRSAEVPRRGEEDIRGALPLALWVLSLVRGSTGRRRFIGEVQQALWRARRDMTMIRRRAEGVVLRGGGVRRLRGVVGHGGESSRRGRRPGSYALLDGADEGGKDWSRARSSRRWGGQTSEQDDKPSRAESPSEGRTCPMEREGENVGTVGIDADRCTSSRPSTSRERWLRVLSSSAANHVARHRRMYICTSTQTGNMSTRVARARWYLHQEASLARASACPVPWLHVP